jgi:DNA-binding transcriptional regulator YiaG
MTAAKRKKPTTPREILEAAIEASGFSARAFARRVLDVNERTVRRWLDGETFGGTPLIVCLAIIEDPAIAAVLAKCVEGVKARAVV